MPVPVFTAGETLDASEMNAVGLWRITTCTVTSAGGTAATASNGVVTIGTNNTSVTVANAFSSDFDNYRIIISGGVSSGNSDASFQLSGITGSNYQTYGFFMTPGTATLNGFAPALQTSWLLGSTNATRYAHQLDVISPFLSQQKFMIGMNGTSTTGSYSFNGLCTSTASATGFTIIANGGTNLTGGKIRVYGYRN